ncbi:uncharacterized protein LOC117611322 isoform X1 [Osmia lignaria lignaria]|uniref:uncharacterized protein LOC117611322 isoform X1 n=1 Tax=Osmia lignaria lignaria TaxID=1437193 RepID=UPI00402BC0CB
MNVTLQKHDGKHIYKVPEGLRELCTDISREVLRSQPANLYHFISEYVDTLLITRENTKIAVKVVNNILLGSEAILSILYRAGFTLEQIAVAAPRIQRAFREYLDAVDMHPVQICDDYSHDEKSLMSIQSILEATGATREDAERAATVIQAAFRGHYERMALNEAQGKVQWQRAVTNTLDILKKAGASQTEISKAVEHLKFAYRGYYTRRNQRLDALGIEQEPLKKDERILEPGEAIQAVAWMEMMYEDSGLTVEKANEAACVIQRAYKKYRARRRCYDVQKLESSKSLVVEAILDSVRHMVFERVTSRQDIPTEYGTQEELMIASTKVQLTIKQHLRKTRFSRESYLQSTEEEYEGEQLYDEEEEEFEDEERGEGAVAEPQSKELEAKAGADYVEEQTEEKDDAKEQAPEAEVTEHVHPSPGLEQPEEAELKEVEKEAEEVHELKETEDQEKVAEVTEVAQETEVAKETEMAEEKEVAEKSEVEKETKVPEETEKTEVAQQTEKAEEAEEPNVAQETKGTSDAGAE